LANSAYISPARPIEDVFSAVQMLGLQRVGALAQALFMLRDNQNAGGVNWRHLWVHALATSSLVDEVQHSLGRPADPQLHLAALLHDVGKIVLSTVQPDTYRALMDEVWNETARLDALETANFGVGHAEAGMAFAQQSRLPELVVAAIAHHADPAAAGPHRLPVAVVSLANYFSKLYGLGFSGNRVDGTDEELRSHPAWAVIQEETGFPPDIEAVAAAVDAAAGGLKQELLSLQRAA
jgi:putative nucleotidyltransferase with HDIG domain